jgi:catechol 2,3-dioxygenase
MSPSPEPIKASPRPIDPGVSIGHVHLKVADLNRAIAFYRDVLGFDLMQRHGDEAAFLSAGGYHHHIALNTWESKGGVGTTTAYNRALPPCHPLSHAGSIS